MCEIARRERKEETMTEHQRFVGTQTTLPLDEQVWQAWVKKNRTKDQQQATEWRRRGALAITALGLAASIYFASLYFVH